MKKSVTAKGSLPALTGLRFFAALGVLLFHYGSTFLAQRGAPAPIVSILANGYLGVSVFFVLSGFILTYAHHDEHIDREFLAKFFFARFARVYPVYIFALLLALPTVQEKLYFSEALRVLLMVQAWTLPESPSGYLWEFQAWTLSVEFAFYLCFPALLMAIRSLGLRSAIALSAVLALCIVSLGTASITPATQFLPFWGAKFVPLPILRMFEFCYGVALCRICCLLPTRDRSSNASLLLVVAIICILSAGRNAHWVATATVLAGVLILELARNQSAINSFLSSKALLLLGGASYALYLLQGPVRAWSDMLIGDPFDRFLSPLISIAGAIAVFLSIEQPARAYLLKAYWRRRPQVVQA